MSSSSSSTSTEGDSYVPFKSTRPRGKDLILSHELYMAIREILAPDFGAKILKSCGVHYEPKN